MKRGQTSNKKKPKTSKEKCGSGANYTICGGIEKMREKLRKTHARQYEKSDTKKKEKESSGRPVGADTNEPQ